MVELNKKQQNISLIFAGIGIGFINGFLGSGGGTLVVVALLLILTLPQKEAHATALLIILPISIVSAIVYIINGNVRWLTTLYATIGVIGGGIAGSFLLDRLNGNVVKLIFSIIMLAAGVKMFIR